MKKASSFIFLISFSAMVLLTSCRARFYTPNRNPVPLFKNKGDVYLDASSNLLSKYDFTAGYALTNGIGLYAGYGGAAQKSTITQNDSAGNVITNDKYHYRGDMLNLGLGYFLNQSVSRTFRFEIFGDLALGSYHNNYVGVGAKSQFLNGNYKRIGIMPNIGYTSEDNRVSFAYSARFSTLRFSNPSISSTTFWETELKRLNSQPSYNMLEHCFFFRVGGPTVKFQMQFALYHGINAQKDNGSAIPNINFSTMAGLVVNTNIFSR